MGLGVRIIPTILTRGRTLVKGERFNSWRTVGVTAQAVRIHQNRGVDEIVILDIGATPEGRGPDLKLVEELTNELFCPLAVGGGIKNVQDVRDLLFAGADKVVLGTRAVGNPALIGNIADRFGSQCLVVAIDVKDGCAMIECGKTATGFDAQLQAIRAQRSGAGEILLTSVSREGTMEGYDLELIKVVADSVDIPVVAHGGCGTYEHMREAIEAGASAVASGAMFQFTDATPKGAAEYLAKNGIEVRL